MLKNKKIALLTNMVTPYRIPFFSELSKHINKLDILTCVDKESDRHWNINNDDCKFNTIKLTGFTLNLPKGNNAKRILHFRLGIITYLLQKKPELLIIGDASWTSFIAAFFCNLLSIPYIIWNEVTTKSNVSKGISSKLKKKTFLNANKCIASCEMAKEYLLQNGVLESKISIVHNAVNNDFFLEQKNKLKDKRNEIRQKLNIRNYTFIYVGQLISRKKVMETINILSNLNRKYHIDVLIAGTGPLENEMRSKAINLGLNSITFFGYTNEEKLCELYTASDALILLSDDEPWGMVINEALLFGLNIFASESVAAAIELKTKHNNIQIINTSEDLEENMLRPLNEVVLKEIPSKESMAKGFYDVII